MSLVYLGCLKHSIIGTPVAIKSYQYTIAIIIVNSDKIKTNDYITPFKCS